MSIERHLEMVQLFPRAAITTCAFPLVALALLWVLEPGYWPWAMRHAVGTRLFSVILFMDFFAFVLLVISRTETWRMFVILTFIVPLYVLCLIGPVLVTIVTSLQT